LPSGRKQVGDQLALAETVGLDFPGGGTTVRLIAADGTVALRNVAGDGPARAFRLGGEEGRVDAVAVSPDGRRLATGGRDHAVRVRDAETGLVLLSLAGHTDSVTGLAFSPEGKSLLSTSADNTVRVWYAPPPR
jgi:WD40 repeat protein